MELLSKFFGGISRAVFICWLIQGDTDYAGICVFQVRREEGWPVQAPKMSEMRRKGDHDQAGEIVAVMELVCSAIPLEHVVFCQRVCCFWRCM